MRMGQEVDLGRAAGGAEAPAPGVRRRRARSVTIITPHYRPETNAGAKRMTLWAEHLAAAGWDVHVLTLLPHYPGNAVYAGYEGAAGVESSENGVSVVRLRPWIVPRQDLLKRLAAETWLSAKLLLALLRLGPTSDVYLASSPFMFLGPAAIIAAKLRRRPFVWDVRDLTWLYPKAAGKRAYGLDIVLDSLMRWVARASDALTTATGGLYAYFVRRPHLGGVVPNGVSREVLAGLAPCVDTLPADGAPPRAVYIGLFGYNHGLASVVEAARLLPEVEFVFVGDGPERGILEAAGNELANVRLLDYRPFEELIEVYRSATVLVSHVRRDPIYRWTQPAKLWEYMASGRPVVHAGEGEVIEILDAEGIAVTVPPDDPVALAEAVRGLVDDPQRARELGLRGRAYVESRRSSETILAELETLLAEVVDARKR